MLLNAHWNRFVFFHKQYKLSLYDDDYYYYYGLFSQLSCLPFSMRGKLTGFHSFVNLIKVLIFNCECFALCDYRCSLIFIFSNTCSKDHLIKQFTLDTSCCTLVINVKFGVYLSTYSVNQSLCKIIQGFWLFV